MLDYAYTKGLTDHPDYEAFVAEIALQRGDAASEKIAVQGSCADAEADGRAATFQYRRSKTLPVRPQTIAEKGVGLPPLLLQSAVFAALKRAQIAYSTDLGQ